MLSVEILGAVCELRPHKPGRSPGIAVEEQEFAVREFADLDDGRRVFWKEDRGWSSFLKFLNSPLIVESGHGLTYEVIMVTDADDLDNRVDAYVEWALDRLREMGLEVDPPSVYFAPFRVEYGPRLEAELRRVAQLFDPPPGLRNRSFQSDATAHPLEDREDRAVLVNVEDDQARLPAWPAPEHLSVRVKDDRGDFWVWVPHVLIERLDEFCHHQKVTRSTVVRRLVEAHLDDRRY